jgi:hypothetical protein
MTLCKNIPELGKAGIRLELEDSVITMSHSESGKLLFQFNATSGDWSSICDFIRSLANKNAGEEILIAEPILQSVNEERFIYAFHRKKRENKHD